MPRELPPPQPALGVLKMRRLHQKDVAAAIGFSAIYTNRCLNSRVSASTKFRRRLSSFLAVPEHELFRDEEVAEAAVQLIKRTRLNRGLGETITEPRVVAHVATAVRSVPD